MQNLKKKSTGAVQVGEKGAGKINFAIDGADEYAPVTGYAKSIARLAKTCEVMMADLFIKNKETKQFELAFVGRDDEDYKNNSNRLLKYGVKDEEVESAKPYTRFQFHWTQYPELFGI